MKPNRDSSELAARLSTAASKPPSVPNPPKEPTLPSGVAAALAPAPSAQVRRKAAQKGRPVTDTVGITLRPAKSLLTRYTMAAAERTREAGRVVSAQEMMLEQLERGPS